MASEAIVAKLSKFTTCDVSDCLLRLKVPRGGFLSNITMWSPERQAGATKIVGPAYTVKYVPLSTPNVSKPPYHYIDHVPKGAVVFVSAPRDIVNAVTGTIMSTRASYLGAVGTIVDGRIRDLQEHRNMKYPLFARDVGTAAPYEVVTVSEINVPVQFSSEHQPSTIISPGDYLIADLNGVVCCPKDLVHQVLEMIDALVEADDLIVQDVMQGKPADSSTKERRKNLKKIDN